MGDCEALPVLREVDVEQMVEQAERFLGETERSIGEQAGMARMEE